MENMTVKQELLAPAGDVEAGYAALYYGADAVYLGLKHFSARATAANFGADDLNEFVAYAHSLGRKVYVALNTLIQEDELPELLNMLDLCVKYKVDALIVQDLGVVRVVREAYPELELHASTQMAVHNKEGALALQKLGFSRVVLARELTLNEIKEIASIPGLETEAFIHGALCYSYSGLCMFSSLETGKSANRGKCLYPCRAAFDGCDGEKHYFSMKDMALQADVLKMPVTSLKIEGRKKTALYVAAVVDYYRHILDGKGDDAERAEHIRQIFSRPWTKFHFNGKNKDVIDRDFVGHRGLKIGRTGLFRNNILQFRPTHKIARYDGIQIDVPGEEKPFGFSLQSLRVGGRNVFEAQVGETVEIKLPSQAPRIEKGWDIYLASSSEVKGAYPYDKPKPGAYKQRKEIDVTVTIEPERLSAEVGGFSFTVVGKFAKAENSDRTTDAVRKAFGKTGDTYFVLGTLTIKNKQGLFAPVSLLNDLRRGLYEQIVFEDEHRLLPTVKEIAEQTTPKWIVKTDKVETLAEIDLDDVSEIVFLLSADIKPEMLSSLPKNKIRLALPTVCRHPKIFAKTINSMLSAGYKKWEIGNYWGLAVLPEKGIDLSFDYSLYMFNTQAVAMAREIGVARVTLSPEDVLRNMKTIAASSLPVVMPIYADVPLFISADCIRSNGCAECPRGEKWLKLKRDGVCYTALSRDCQIMLFDERSLCFAVEAKEVNVAAYRVDFCFKTYSAKQAAQIWECVRRFQDVNGCAKGNICKPALL